MYDFKRYHFAIISVILLLSVLAFESNHAQAQTSMVSVNNQYCAKENLETHVVLIDQTVEYDQIDRQLFVNWYKGFLINLKPRSRVMIYEMRELIFESNLIFAQCVPACPEWGDDFSGNLVDNCRRSRHEAPKENFMSGLFNLLQNDLANGKPGKRSPILFSIEKLLNEIPSDSIDRLTIVSDMIEYQDGTSENIKEFNQEDKERLLKLARDIFVIPSQLANTKVRIYGVGKELGSSNDIPRDATKNRKFFWEEVFKDLLGVRDFDIKSAAIGLMMK